MKAIIEILNLIILSLLVLTSSLLANSEAILKLNTLGHTTMIPTSVPDFAIGVR